MCIYIPHLLSTSRWLCICLHTHIYTYICVVTPTPWQTIPLHPCSLSVKSAVSVHPRSDWVSVLTREFWKHTTNEKPNNKSSKHQKSRTPRIPNTKTPKTQKDKTPNHQTSKIFGQSMQKFCFLCCFCFELLFSFVRFFWTIGFWILRPVEIWTPQAVFPCTIGVRVGQY